MYENENYNQFEPLRNASFNILDYLIDNNENLFKLLKYIGENDNPYTKPSLTKSEKLQMIAKNSYDLNESTNKNILFMIDTKEGFSANVAQLRIEVGDVKPINSYQGYMNIWFQIVSPIVNEVMGNTNTTGERRTDAIFLELVKSLNGQKIPNIGFNSELFMNIQAQDGTGRKNGSYRENPNTEYTSRMVCFSVLI